MKITFKALTVLVLLLTFSVGQCLAVSFPNAAVQAAETFVKILDSQNYEIAYQETSLIFKTVQNEDLWLQKAEATRKLMGNTLKRTLKSIKITETYSGLPDGDYILVYFENQMEFKKKASEVVLLKNEDGSWNICHYSLK